MIHDNLRRRIRKTAQIGAEALDLQASFGEGRRRSDIIVIKLRGDQEGAYTLADNLKSLYPDLLLTFSKPKAPTPDDPVFKLTLLFSDQNLELPLDHGERRSHLRAHNHIGV